MSIALGLNYQRVLEKEDEKDHKMQKKDGNIRKAPLLYARGFCTHTRRSCARTTEILARIPNILGTSTGRSSVDPKDQCRSPMTMTMSAELIAYPIRTSRVKPGILDTCRIVLAVPPREISRKCEEILVDTV